MGFLQDHPPDNMIRITLLACTAALAAADADALYGIAGHHLGYGVGHVGYAAHHVAPVHHAVHAVPVHHGYGISNVANTVGIHGAAPAAIPAAPGGYAGAGRYVANSAGVVHIAKRSADADSYYGGYYGGYAGYGARSYGDLYGGYRGYGGYGGYGFGGIGRGYYYG